MRKLKKKYERPLKPWDRARIELEKGIVQDYGLRRKREIWRAESILRNYRRLARQLAAKRDKEREKILIEKVHKTGLLPSQETTLDDVLALTVERVLERRLQTQVFRKGLASSMKQARQFVVHGHIALDGRRVRQPSTLLKSGEEGKLSFYEKSKIKLSGEKVGKTT